MTFTNTAGDWSTRARAMASEKWRRQSAIMGSKVTEAVVEEAQPQPGMRVLDVASGTGEPALSVAERVGPEGHVTGTDISSASLAIAERRAQKRGLTNITFLTADVHRLPFPDASFDLVTSRCGAMFFLDLAGAMSEVRRVLKPEGRMAFLVWGPFEQDYFQACVGTILKMIPGAEVPPGARAMFKFGQKGVISAALIQAGFREVEEDFRSLPWVWPGPVEELWEYFQEVTVPFRPLLESIPPARRPAVEARIKEELGRYYDGQQVNFSAVVVIATARR